MTIFLTEVTKKLAEYWVRLVVLPGLLYLAALAVVWPLVPWRRDVGPLGALRVGRVPVGLGELIRTLVGGDAATLVAGPVLLLLGSLLVGRVIAVAGKAVERVWLGVWPAWIAKGRIANRSEKWWSFEKEAAEMRDLDQSSVELIKLEKLHADRNRISMPEPIRPTWMGDRMATVETNVINVYQMPLRRCWTHLWLVLPEHLRVEVQSARQAFGEQALLAAWGVLYVVTAAYWWPAGLIGLITIVAAWRRGRACLDQFAELVEATVDLHGATLARALGLAVSGTFTADIGDQIAAIVRKNG